MNFSLILAVLLCLNGLFYIYKYFWSTRYIRNQFSAPNQQKKIQFEVAILCSVFNEQKKIESFLENLKHLLHPTDVYIITTANDHPDENGKTTLDILENSSLGENFYALQYSGANQSKSVQLNYALEHIELKGKEYDLILCLDVDSYVPPDIVHSIQKVYNPAITAYQQPILWYKNYNSYSHSLSAYLMKSFCHLQSYHSIAFEIPMLKSFPANFRLKYLIGNGMCIRHEDLKNVGGFPDLIDDTRLGKILDFQGKKFEVIPGFGIVESANNVLILIKQMSMWFFGCNLIIEDFKVSRKQLSLLSMTKIMYAYLKQARWCLFGPSFVFLFIDCLYRNDSLWILVLISALMNYSIPTFLMLKQYEVYIRAEKTGLMETFKVCAISPAHIIISTISLSLGLFKYLKYIFLNKIDLYKTER